MPSAKLAADMAVMAERTGASVDEIVSINEMFQRIDGSSEATAMNLSEGLRNMADQANIGLGGLMREIADASKDALSYQIKSGPALAKQVAYAQSLGVNFGDIAKAGKSMVMNYSDSIKKEMQLSAMLGKNVDLSEVRAKFASGDTAGALKSLQAQGLDPAQMDMFAQEALSEALGGLDLNTLSKLSQNTGKTVSLTAADAKAGNQEFISRTQAAEVALNSKQAVISANSAMIDQALSQKIADSYMDSDEYRELKMNQSKLGIESSLLATNMEIAWKSAKAFTDQMVESSKLDFVSDLKQNIVGGIAMTLGGIATSFIGSKLTGGGGGLLSMFGRGRGAGTGGGTGGSSALGAPGGVGAGLPIPAGSPGGMGGAAGGLGGALQGIAKGLGSFVGAPLIGLAAITIALKVLEPVIASLVPVMVKLSEVIGNVLVKALEMAGPIITSIFDGIGNVIKSIGTGIATVINSISASIGQFAVMDAKNLGSVAWSITKLAASVGAFGVGNVVAAIGGFFGKDIFAKIKDISHFVTPIQKTANAVTALADAFGSLSSINTKALNDIPWVSMAAFSAAGGKIVTTANSDGGSFTLSKETATNINRMATNTDAMVKLNDTMVRILQFGKFKDETAYKLYLDGKQLNKSSIRYTDNTKGRTPPKG
jgi:hypothetical protein